MATGGRFWFNHVFLVFKMGEMTLLTNLAFSDLKTFLKMMFMSLFSQFLHSDLPRPSIFIISLLMPLMTHEYMIYVTFFVSKIVLRHPKRDASKNV